MSKYVFLFALLLVTAIAVKPFSVPADVPAAGTAAPTFKLVTNEGKEASLADFKGKWVVPLFLPERLHQRLHARSPQLPTRPGEI